MEVNILLPEPVRTILGTLQQQGHSAFAVGGCIRDSLMGRTPNDWDICTSARPGEIRAAFSGHCLNAPGIRHGTVTVLMDHTLYEVTTYRADGVYSDHRHPDGVRFVRSVSEDLRRRDFTVNAMAYSPSAGLVDLFGGKKDLHSRCLRCVGDPAQRFSEDALRILRMARFESVLDFQAEPRTAAAAAAKCGLLKNVAAERLREEFCRLLCGGAAGTVLRRRRELLVPLMPETARAADTAWEETALAVQNAPEKLSVRLGILARVLKEDLRVLCPDHKTADEVLLLAQYADAPLQAMPPVIRRWLHQIGPECLGDLVMVQKACAAAQQDGMRQEELEAFSALLCRMLASGACYERPMLAVNGADAMAAGIREGTAVGAALEKLLSLVIDGTLPNDRAVLLDRLHMMNGAAQQFEQESLFG